MKKMTPDTAKALAKVLADNGIVSAAAEEWPNPKATAFRAFKICYSGSGQSEWDDLHKRLKDGSMPSAAYFRKVSEICLRALRRPNLADDLREPITFAWGYFNGLLKAEIS